MIQAKNLYKSYGAKIIAENISLNISPGQRIGLIGPNGTGKSTLFKILLGIEPPDKGEIVRSGTMGLLPQSISFTDSDSVYDYLKDAIKEEWQEYLIPAALADVGMDAVELSCQIKMLSGGQKTRLGIARLLIEDCDMIFLDEPTNNLDINGLLWLEKFVIRFKGSVVIISHDRTFLDSTVNKIFELDPFTHSINEYTGNYSDYVVERLNRREKQLAAYADFDERRKDMEEWIALEKQKQSNHADPKGGKRLNAMKTKYEKFVENESLDKPKDFQKIRIGSLGEETHRKKVIFYIEDFSNDLFAIDKLAIHGGDRIHLKGSNGAGKSTLIKLLLEHAEAGVKVGYFAQEHEILDFNNTVMEEMLKKTNVGSESRARQVVGKFAIRGASVFNSVEGLSQGERVKLILAILTNQGNNFLVLDEPTNHLDLESREILEEALADFSGGFIVVSHDRYFLKQIGVNREVKINSGKVSYSIV
ncbi:MAG: ATP-binding cassette domain-containing protein [bacterium]|nr:ATP-binding cassette domain-containing protein [bacterium]